MSLRIEQLVVKRVQECSSQRAIVDDAAVTYKEIELGSNQAANFLIDHGLRPDDRVCLISPKSTAPILMMFGILKAGGVYLPIDFKTPPLRLARIFNLCEPHWIVADPGLAEVIAEALHQVPSLAPKLCWLGDVSENVTNLTSFSNQEISQANTTTPVPKGTLCGTAAILFTSGSTGEPKGVPIKHEDLVELFSWVVPHFNLGPDDRVSSHAALHFDSSLWDIFCALTSGAELHIVPSEANLLPNRLADFIRRSRLTQWASVPAALIAMANRGDISYNDFPDLRRLMWYGEALPTRYVRYWMERLPHAEFTNFYGPTEVTLISTYHTVPSIPDADGAPVPIGKKVPGRKLVVLDALDQPVEAGEIGELAIGGSGVSPGYWRQPEKTAAAFFESPVGSGERWYRTGDLVRIDAGGVCHFHGRADRQIKLRGYRIELDEVELALSRVAGIAEAAIIAILTPGVGFTRISAAFVKLDGHDCAPEQLRKELARTLPSYMLPTGWLEVAALPRNQNGKVDYNEVKKLFIAEP